MAKKDTQKAGKNIEAVEEALSKTEQYIERNQKTLLYILGGIVLLVGAYFGYQRYYLQPKEKDAQQQMFMAEQYFAKDSLDKALYGDGMYLGFIDIIDEYGITKSANLAHYYAGIIFLKKGEFEEAIEHLEDFKSSDVMISSMGNAALGDAYLETGEYESAIKHYLKAARDEPNQFTTPTFLKKAAWAYELQNNYTEAAKIYEEIEKEYFMSYEARDIKKYKARAQKQANGN